MAKNTDLFEIKYKYSVHEESMSITQHRYSLLRRLSIVRRGYKIYDPTYRDMYTTYKVEPHILLKISVEAYNKGPVKVWEAPYKFLLYATLLREDIPNDGTLVCMPPNMIDCEHVHDHIYYRYRVFI